MFGERAFQEALGGVRPEESPVMEKLKRGLVGFLDGLEPHDDVSILTLNLGAARVGAMDAGSCA